jgi:hypothetical protein
MRVEVKRAFWMPLTDAVRKLSYRGEKDMARRAQTLLHENTGEIV